ncbi:SCO family protein [Roseomonas populi]|uniref:SCO family protein n=1 Tax=Roseomonas populi TaxID=3121582 RepID=A0ABT1X6A6_9PROT|nr:SCO family protein [Roseomonas pecuniae]MCR0983636.1 SCO family protein [Roseomonas pecuniae]
MSRSLIPLGRRSALGLLLGLAAARAAGAGEEHAHAHAHVHAEAEAAPPGSAAIRLRQGIPDARVTDSHRRRRRLVSEVFGGRVVAIDFVLTDCGTFCSAISAAMAGAQEALGPRLSREAGLVSVALDPFGGTPEQLNEYAARFGAGPAWSFVNVPETQLDEVLRSLGGPIAGESHSPMVVVLDPLRREVRRLLGIPSPEAIANTIEAALAARKA